LCIFFSRHRDHPDLHSFPTRRSSDLPEDVMRGYGPEGLPDNAVMFCGTLAARGGIRPASRFEFEIEDPVLGRRIAHGYDVVELPDRKSTRLNSSHVKISYAVFCLKKK